MPLPLNEFRAVMDMGKKDGCSKKLKKREKRAVLLHTRTFFIQWVAAGLARPATAVATTAATFIDWIDLAAPPVSVISTPNLLCFPQAAARIVPSPTGPPSPSACRPDLLLTTASPPPAPPTSTAVTRRRRAGGCRASGGGARPWRRKRATTEVPNKIAVL